MASQENDNIDWRSFAVANPTVLAEIIRQAELRLQAQLQSALAADARAGVLASIQGAAAAGLMVVAMSGEVSRAAATAALSAGVCLAVGSVCCAFALRPVPFCIVGNYPSMWLPDLAGESIIGAQAGTAAYYDEHLKKNEAQMASNNGLTRVGIFALVVSPMAGLLGAAVERICG